MVVVAGWTDVSARLAAARALLGEDQLDAVDGRTCGIYRLDAGQFLLRGSDDIQVRDVVGRRLGYEVGYRRWLVAEKTRVPRYRNRLGTTGDVELPVDVGAMVRTDEFGVSGRRVGDDARCRIPGYCERGYERRVTASEPPDTWRFSHRCPSGSVTTTSARPDNRCHRRC